MSRFLDVVAAAGPALVARATVVLVVAAALAAVLRSSSAAERHLVWAWALAAVLALPAIHRAIPAWPILPVVGTGDGSARPVGGGRLAFVAAFFAALAVLAAVVAPAVARDDTPADPPLAGLLGEWFDAAADTPGDPLEIGEDGDGLWLTLAGSKARLEPVTDDARLEGPRPTIAVAVIADAAAERRVRIERKPLGLSVEIATRFTDGSGRPGQRVKTAYARRDDFLPNGYYLFFANSTEAGLAKEGVNFGAIVAGPHVPELGNSGDVIYGRIDPKPDLPPHPDHAPGFFLIDSATDAVKTGLDHEAWLAELDARSITKPKLVPSQQKWPKRQ